MATTKKKPVTKRPKVRVDFRRPKIRVDFNAITFETDVPVPDNITQSRAGYPFAKLRPGESFHIPCTVTEAEVIVKNARSAGNRIAKTLKRKFVCGVVDDGVRCWRTDETPEAALLGEIEEE